MPLLTALDVAYPIGFAVIGVLPVLLGVAAVAFAVYFIVRAVKKKNKH